MAVLKYKRILSAGFIKRGSHPEGKPLLEGGGASCLLEMGSFSLKLGLRRGARQGPQQEPGPLLAHFTRRDVEGAISMKIDDIRPNFLEKKEGGSQKL